MAKVHERSISKLKRVRNAVALMPGPARVSPLELEADILSQVCRPSSSFVAAENDVDDVPTYDLSALDLVRKGTVVTTTPNVTTSDVCPVNPPFYAKTRARLLSLDLEDFKVFKNDTISFEDKATCIVGPNSCGKSSILDAIRFILLRKGYVAMRSLVRRSMSVCTRARARANFECDGIGVVSLERIILVNKTGCDCVFRVFATGMLEFQQVSEESYSAWLSALCWLGGDLIVPQFGLLKSRTAAELLALLPGALEQLSEEDTGAPLLKRRSPQHRQTSQLTVRVTAEACVARRFNEIYRELTREPLDDSLETWSEGNQGLLRKLEGGAFSLCVSEKPGAAACGLGVPLSSLSDGDQDVCALALLLALPGLLGGVQGTLPLFVVLDEPDARLDKRHACALWRFLSGSQGPKQCLIMSLNNLAAFDDVPHVALEVTDPAVDAGKDASQLRPASQELAESKQPSSAIKRLRVWDRAMLNRPPSESPQI